MKKTLVNFMEMTTCIMYVKCIDYASKGQDIPSTSQCMLINPLMLKASFGNCRLER